MTNSADPDQLASAEANWAGSTLFANAGYIRVKEDKGYITKTYLHVYNFDPLKPHFYIVKLGFTGVYIIVLISAQDIDCGYSLELPHRGSSNEYSQSVQSSRKRRIRRICTPIFAFVRVKFPSEDSYLRSIATGRPNWTSKTYRGLPKFLLSVKIDTRDVQKLSKSPPTFNELYDVCPAYLLEIRYLCWLSFKDVPLSACGSFIDIGVKRRGTFLMAAWSLCVFVTRAELINWCLYN